MFGSLPADSDEESDTEIDSNTISLAPLDLGKIIAKLTLYRPMEFSLKPFAIKSGWSIVFIEGSQVITAKKNVFLSLKIGFVLANSADTDETPWNFTKEL